jgi:hypothetical protein
LFNAILVSLDLKGLEYEGAEEINLGHVRTKLWIFTYTALNFTIPF